MPGALAVTRAPGTQPALPLAVSLGDPAGIGPEVIVAAWAARAEAGVPAFAVIGGAQVLRSAAQRRGIACPVAMVGSVEEAATIFASALPVVGDLDGEYTPRLPDDAGARLAWGSLTRAIALTSDGRAAAVVTAPVSKARIAAIIPDFIGQTELLADACALPREDSVMMLAGPNLRTVPLTVHCALAEVSQRLTAELILRRCRTVDRALRVDFGIAAPHLAIAGLNPHAGEEGRMGREEIETIAPAIAALRAEAINATGPHPADTLFAPHKRPTYDVAIAMYHDQALVPLKALDFDSGVNITLGLPIVRTSPDHGTAFDIAGQRIANPSAMIAALRMAGEVAVRRAAADA